jgi:hypothetical protein
LGDVDIPLRDHAVLDPFVVEGDDALHDVGQPLRVDHHQVLQPAEGIVEVHQRADVVQKVHHLAQILQRNAAPTAQLLDTLPGGPLQALLRDTKR